MKNCLKKVTLTLQHHFNPAEPIDDHDVKAESVEGVMMNGIVLLIEVKELELLNERVGQFKFVEYDIVDDSDLGGARIDENQHVLLHGQVVLGENRRDVVSCSILRRDKLKLL